MRSISILLHSPSSLIFLAVNALGGIAVALGLWGEAWAEKRKFSEQPCDLTPHISECVKRKKCKRFFEWLLLGGVIWEVVAAVITTSVSELEVGASNERAASLELEAADAELKLAEITNNITKNNPANLPVYSVTADVGLVVIPATNLPDKFDFAGRLHLLGTNLFGVYMPSHIRMASAGSATAVRFGRPHGEIYAMSFSLPDLRVLESEHFLIAGGKSAKEAGAILDSLDLQMTDVSITNANVVRGFANVRLNGVVEKRFSISPSTITNGEGNLHGTSGTNVVQIRLNAP